jgi:hypothetical protein
MGTLVKVLAFAVLIIFLVVLGPLVTIWALNTLFPVLAIPYTFDTWLAVIIVGGLFKTSVNVKK